MSKYLGKLVFYRIFQESRENNQGRDDPYFEYVPTKKLVSFSGKPSMRRRKKSLPPGLSRKDQKTLVKVKRRAYRLDMGLGTCCGIKLGWGSLIGIIPGFGDVADSLLALMVVHTASEVGLSTAVQIHMLINVAFDFLIGLVPFLGDLADMAYKANTRNAVLLEDYLRERGQENLRRSGLPQQPDPSLGEVEVDDPVVTTQPIAEPRPTASRGWSGREREYDVEAQRGAGRSGSSSKHSSSKRKSPKGRSKSSRGHGRLQSQETGITVPR